MCGAAELSDGCAESAADHGAGRGVGSSGGAESADGVGGCATLNLRCVEQGGNKQQRRGVHCGIMRVLLRLAPLSAAWNL